MTNDTRIRHVQTALAAIGNVPVTTSVLGSLLDEVTNLNDKIHRLEKSGDIIRLKRGLYVVSSDITHKPVSVELAANHLYAPSYVSCRTALRFYGLIPEAVYSTESMTLKHARTFETPIGVFSYSHVAHDVFPIGLTNLSRNDCSFIIASPEKALCDLIATSPQVNLRYKTDAQRYLEEDLRLDMDAFRRMNPDVFRAYSAVGKKLSSIRTLLKLLSSL